MKKILIANRGEIALRIMQTAKEMGISTVAIFPEADRTAPHVMYADSQYVLGLLHLVNLICWGIKLFRFVKILM